MKALWTIIVIVVLVVLGYGGYKVMNKQQQAAPSPTPVAMKATTKPTPSAMAENSVYKMVQKDKVGAVMSDVKGMTLYTYDKDTKGVSNCTGQCLVNWPAYTASSAAGTLPANVSVVKRSDGTMQYAWKGMPLYYWFKDKTTSDATGDGVGGIWHVVKSAQ